MIPAKRHQSDEMCYVLLGASNLTLGWHDLMRVLQESTSQPFSVHTALGMGRSYVGWSGFGFRRLPGIRECGIWGSLSSDIGPKPRVLLTDLGNDLVYGRSAEVVVQAAEDCINRLREWRADCDITITSLPMDSVQALGPARFRIARAILFTGCKLTLTSIQQAAQELDKRVRLLASKHSISVADPLPEWYGFDPIHIRRPLRMAAFQHLFGFWPDFKRRASTSPLERVPLPTAAQRLLFNKPRTTVQPVYRGNRVEVSAY